MTKEEIATATAKGIGVKIVEYVPIARAVIEGDLRGGPFTIVGKDFGNEKGVLMVGAEIVKTTSWNDTRIKGQMPAGLTGLITITVGGEARIIERKA